jgi:GNAT superfamily N-acetyltransferase
MNVRFLIAAAWERIMFEVLIRSNFLTVTKYINHQYEIIWITRPEDLKIHANLIESFFALYEDPSNFPDPDELEEPKFIIERIAEGTNDPHTHLMAYVLLAPDGERKFVAGCIVEFYPDSRCALVTYLFVNQEFRGQKIGVEEKKVAESLIMSDRGLKGLIRFFEIQYGMMVNAVLFESNNPFDTLPENDSMPPEKRLKFFSRLGARRIDFDYVQPPLGDDKEIVTNLYLLSFPWLTGLSGSVPAKVVIRFVMELAKSLDRNKERGASTAYGYQNYLHDANVIAGDAALLDPDVLIGLNAQGRNIIREMWADLMSKSTDRISAQLTDIPGVEMDGQ